MLSHETYYFDKYFWQCNIHSTIGYGWTDLQVEAGALGHGGEGTYSGHRGQGAHQHEHTPAVELVGRAHLETPAWCQGESEREREREREREITWLNMGSY